MIHHSPLFLWCTFTKMEFASPGQPWSMLFEAPAPAARAPAQVPEEEQDACAGEDPEEPGPWGLDRELPPRQASVTRRPRR